jgi:hypothetical protein
MPKLGQELCQTPLSIFGSVLYQVLLPWLTMLVMFHYDQVV